MDIWIWIWIYGALYITKLTVFFCCCSLAQTKTKAKSLNGKQYSKDKINTKSDMYKV